jgi:hypothetical protein
MRGTARRMSTRERMRLAAAEKIGHDQAYWLLVWMPIMRVAVPTAAVGIGGYWVWENVDHARIVIVVAVLGIVCLLTYATALLMQGGLKARMRRRVMGQRLHAGWHLVGLAGAVLLIAAYLAAGA